jgi:hypothetical protein
MLRAGKEVLCLLRTSPNVKHFAVFVLLDRPIEIDRYSFFEATVFSDGSCVVSQPPPRASLSCTLLVSCWTRSERTVC